MFHAGGHKGINTRGRSSALSRHYPHFLSHVDWKAPLRCGVLFCVFSCTLFVVGIILTWLGVHDMFGETVPITGPILLTVGGLMLILAFRQFYIAHARKIAHNKAVKSKELGVAAIAAIAEQDEDQYLTDAESHHQKDRLYVSLGTSEGSDDPNVKSSLNSGGYCESNTLGSSYGGTLNAEGYMWPPVALQHPYYSMAMMVYKDPSLICLPCISSPGLTNNFVTGPIFAANTNREVYEGGEATETIPSGSPSSSPLLKQRDTAILATSSVTLQEQTSLSCCSPSASDSVSRLESVKIFPADYLTTYKRTGSVRSSASAGISNLPNPTAFMMLRTLELQETI